MMMHRLGWSSPRRLLPWAAWDTARYLSTAPKRLSWDTTLAALKAFSEQHGHVQVPQAFVVDADHSNVWPAETKGVKLGRIVNRLRIAWKKNALTEAQQMDLTALGFDRGVRMTWNDKLAALKRYRDLHGHTNVPTSFEVPTNDPQWPAPFAGLALGSAVKGLRFHQAALPTSRRRALDELGFVWSAWDQSWQKRVLALKTYRDLYGNLDVSPDFNVPVDDNRWPREVWGMKLHDAVRNIRSRSHRLNFEQLDELESLGFLWDKVGQTFACRADAWKVYRTVYKSKDVPAEFVVPTNHKVWPIRMWGLPLGRVVHSIRSKPSRLTLQQLAYLHNLGLLPKDLINVIG
ncbi:hypothetical protein H257_14353 [Aphanomyces astaci]|uniref:Helicase-associated domain-containing protein n=2 Tax=Aphanomyces astaci TaxID=112090 RepID=W4FTJ7_APHAT|nr:hypothetical protein H257_14353 [Aphanomyces astaci]ETV69983.1 hypothetical protein H257_14353 [Aphanomyces astaci]|eukprot:XP_009840426.1 hypothetical protein H257_14353 [Aphanomyces astaci]